MSNLNNQVELQKVGEKNLFTDEHKTKDLEKDAGCCRNKHTKNCCIATGCFGGIFLLLGIIVMLAGGPMLEKKISETMALFDGSERYESWLRPPVQPHLEGYAFNVTNAKDVLNGAKPKLQEVGPFIYKSTTLKDSDDNVQFWGDGTLTYRPRKVYTLVPEKSVGNPDDMMITVPNIPYWTGVWKGQKKGSGFAKNTAFGLIQDNGLNAPFIDVSFSGLLWGYKDELPCLKLEYPSGCSSGGGNI